MVAALTREPILEGLHERQRGAQPRLLAGVSYTQMLDDPVPCHAKTAWSGTPAAVLATEVERPCAVQ